MNKDIMIAAGFGDAVARMEKGQCTTCGIPVNEKAFVDEINAREFAISGMCQSCQDAVFASDIDDWSLEQYDIKVAKLTEQIANESDDLTDDAEELAHDGWATDGGANYSFDE